MAKRTNMTGPVTHGELRRELGTLEAKIDARFEAQHAINLEIFATKADLERYATKEDLERFATKADLERYATKEDLEIWGGALLARIESVSELSLHTQARLEAWGGALLTRIEGMSGDLARHVQAILESMSTQVRVVDEKYADLPERVTRLEHDRGGSRGSRR